MKRRGQATPTGRLFGWLVAAAMIIGGLMTLLFGFWQPLQQVKRARDWKLASCKLDHAKLHVSYDADGDPQYALDVQYSIEVDGLTYVGGRYSFFDSHYRRKKTIRHVAKRLAQRDYVWCYHDPIDPSHSVIDRSWHNASLLAMCALGLVILGLALCIHLARRQSRVRNGLPGIEQWRNKQTADGRVTLRPTRDRVMYLLLPLALTSVAVPLALGMWHSFPDWSEARFLVRLALGLVALATLSWLVYVVLEFIGPRIRITLPTLQLRPGDSVTFTWAARSISPAIRSVQFILEGRELATVDDSERADSERTFLSRELEQVSASANSKRGEVKLDIADTVLPSFESEHNHVFWVVRVVADVAFWPDVDDEFELVILPMSEAS